MPRCIYLNGQYLPLSRAGVSPQDRGFLMGDAVYEVIGCIHGYFADETGHLDRLERSLNELQMSMPVERETLRFLMRELLRRNGYTNAAIYIQVTRGSAKRDFGFPAPDTPQTLMIITYDFDFDNQAAVTKGVKIKSVSDIRWKRRDIKTVLLLPQSLAKQTALDNGAGDAWMLDEDGYVNEASASNAYIVKGNKIITSPVSHNMLRGITRTAIEKLCRDSDMIFEERQFKLTEAFDADEAFNTSATSLIVPVIDIDGNQIGNGKRGKITTLLYNEYRAYVEGLRGEQVRWEAGL